MTPKPLHLAGFTLFLSLGGCWDASSNTAESGSREDPEKTNVSQGGTGTAALSGSTDVNTRLGAATGGATAADTHTPSGGAPDSGVATQSGGTSPLGNATEAGGSAQTSVTVQTGGTSPIQSTDSHPQGGNWAASTVSGTATGGTAATSTNTAAGGAAPASTITSAGGTAPTGAGGSSGGNESICNDGGGAPVPYDYSFGLMGEYAFALSMDCNVGGYVMPLVMADPEQLSQVNAFIADATDWYRSQILNCSGATTRLGADDYGLLPVSLASDLSEADCDASLALFLTVVDRHDSQPDAVSPSTKDKIKSRIKSIKARAVRSDAVGLTKPLSEPDCIPAEPVSEGG